MLSLTPKESLQFLQNICYFRKVEMNLSKTFSWTADFIMLESIFWPMHATFWLVLVPLDWWTHILNIWTSDLIGESLNPYQVVVPRPLLHCRTMSLWQSLIHNYFLPNNSCEYWLQCFCFLLAFRATRSVYNSVCVCVCVCIRRSALCDALPSVRL